VKRPWFRSRSVRIAGAAVFLAACCAAIVPFLVPIDSYRPLLVWAVESATGRDVQIDALKLSLLPTVHITVVNFRMKNPPGFPAGDALTASSIDLGIAPQALLSRRLDITYIAPAGVKVNVLRNAAGGTNFATTAATTTPAQKPAPIFTLEHVGPVTLKDAEVTFADALGSVLPAPAFSLRGVSGTIGSIDPQAPDWAKKLSIVADLRGAQLALSNVTQPVDFHTGELTIKGGAARSTFSLSLGNVDLAGAAAFAHLDPLSISFAVSGPELDFKTLAAFLNGAHGGAIPAAKARRLIAHGTVKIAKVIFAPLAASQLTGQLDLYTGSVRLNAWTVSAYGGTVRGNAELDGSAGAPLAVTAQAHGLNLPQVLAALGAGSENVTGALDTDFRLTTLLARNPQQALKTTGTFAVRDGSLPSIAFKGMTLPSADTRFSYFGGDLRIAGERGYSNQLTLQGSDIQATSHGSFGFDRNLQYSGTGIVNALTQATSLMGSPLLASLKPILANVLQQNIGSAQLSAPFTLRGTLEDPQFALSGTPQLITGGDTSQAAQLPANVPSIQDLVNLIPGI
jgi:hypothetical protein